MHRHYCKLSDECVVIDTILGRLSKEGGREAEEGGKWGRDGDGGGREGERGRSDREGERECVHACVVLYVCPCMRACML